jgi:putative tryptophan/tyrosine transport system substrate-binding protein
MRRREFIAGVGAAAAWPVVSVAQQPGRTYRIASLSQSPIRRDHPFWDDLKRNGLVEGQNLLLDVTGMGVPLADLQTVADGLVKTGLDAFVTWGAAAAHAVQHATTSIPIVALTDDPVEDGLVTSMSQPGGNITGVGLMTSQLDAKRLEVLHELLPTAKRIGVLIDPTQKLGLRQIEALGRDLGLELIAKEVPNADRVGQAIDALTAAHVEAINILASAMFYGARKLIIDRMRALRLPTIYWFGILAREGGLISYGPTEEEGARLLVRQLIRVLNGAAPGQLPVLQPTRFELVINLKTAKSVGLTVPPALLLRADEVIE